MSEQKPVKELKLNREEIRAAIEAGDNGYGRRWLAVTPAGEWAIHWADKNGPWHPWEDGALTTPIPALYPDGEGQEAEAAQECLEDRLGRQEAKRLEDQCYESDLSLVEYAEEHYPDWMAAHRDNQLDWLEQAFLDACNGDGEDLRDSSAPWGTTGDALEIIDPPFEFEWAE